MIILVVNAKISEVSLPAFFPIFAGEYVDFTVEWYKVVGATITLTMMINIITPHLSVFLKMMKSSCLKCCDRGCTFDRRKTKKYI